MKYITLLLLALLTLVGCGAKAQDKTQTTMTNNTKKVLVAYFSYSGTTRAYAKKIAGFTGADLFEIEAEQPYTDADVDWTADGSRVNKEKEHPELRPAIKNKVENMDPYDVVLNGFPIWWYIEPNIINTFLETNNFEGKRLVPFFTSASSGPGETDKHLHASISYAVDWQPVVRANSMNDSQLKAWAEKAIQ
jgi:flavodoxin